MTQKQAQTIEQALARAAKEGIRIIGTGTMKADGSRFWLVTSSKYAKTNKGYIVTLAGGHLVCNCEAIGICKHRAVCHAELKEERKEVPPAPAAPAPTIKPTRDNALPASATAPECKASPVAGTPAYMWKSEDHNGDYLPRDHYQHAYR